MAAKKKAQDVSIDIVKLDHESFRVLIVGDTPMIYNSMSEKAKQDLMLPPDDREKKRRKQSGVLKHNPITEYRGSVYRFRDDDQPTRLLFPGGGAKAAIARAAIDIPGAAKAQMGRLCQVIENDIPIWGIPELMMSVVRNSGMNKTPDIRTRAILREWCAGFTVRITKPNLTVGGVANLVAAAGLIIGLGDWRPEKGSGNYGTFHLVESEKDEDFARITKTGGREVQDAALETPNFYDVETEELMEWFQAECKRREIKIAS